MTCSISHNQLAPLVYDSNDPPNIIYSHICLRCNFKSRPVYVVHMITASLRYLLNSPLWKENYSLVISISEQIITLQRVTNSMHYIE